MKVSIFTAMKILSFRDLRKGGYIRAAIIFWMEHYFDLPVIYKGEEHSFKGRLATFGYIYKFYIIVDGRELVFEKDDEGEYRVLTEADDKAEPVDASLMQAIIAVLGKLSK